MRYRFTLRQAIRLALLLGLAAAPARAQTDYYNTDRYRPLRIEDPYPTERHAIDFHLAPIRLERLSGGAYVWEADPEIAWGFLPRTHLELGLPLSYADVGGDERRVGLHGVELSVLHALNVETRSVPALGLRATALLPVGGLAAERTYASLQGIATRTFRWARFHVNAEYTAGDEPGEGEEVEVPRWLAGVAVDRAFPLSSLLVGGEVFAAQPLHEDEDLAWNAAVGVRWQLDPHFAVDAGVGRRLTGAEQAWFVTFGLARVLGVKALIPGF